MARFFSFRSSFTLKERERYGVRGWAGKPTHPPLTDFPITCYVLAALLDTAGLVAASRAAGWAHDASTSATWLEVVGLCASVLAAATGFLDRPAATPRTQVWRTVNAHAALMIAAMLVALAAVTLHFVGPAWGGTPTSVAVLAVLAAVLTASGAWIGTDLVYEHGFRVEPSRDTPAWNPSQLDFLPGGQALYPDRWRWSGGRRPADADEVRLDAGIESTEETPGRGPAADALERLWQLDELRHEGVISQDDFERKKLELLSRI